MMKTTNPLAFWSNAVELGYLMAEAQAVIAMRVMGMAGVWSVTGGEDSRMISEKAQAVSQSTTNATRAAMAGRSPDQIAAAAIKPFRQKTRANVKRLQKRGPKIPKI
ncbi:antifreeze protein [Loktanella agnita]|uniref:antifreeze protein n=1 Tax=Loktanella agnita TaxID=287097 RepID=UPI0039868304